MDGPPRPTRAAPTPITTLYPIGIKTSFGKYLTVETFGDQLNGNGPSLRTKQVWLLETDGTEKYAFKSHKGKYLSADHREIKATADSKTANEWFHLEFNDGSCTIKASSGKYVSCNETGQLSVLTASPDAQCLFEIQINYHPQVCLWTQKRYLALEGETVMSNRDTQFGRETMFVREDGPTMGQYAFKGINGKYMGIDPKDSKSQLLCRYTDKSDASTLFCFEFHGVNLALKNIGTGKYLNIAGNGLKAEREKVTPKEIFVLRDSDLQIALKSVSSGKFVSWQGTNLILKENATEPSHSEIFILETDNNTSFKVSMKTYTDQYWSCHKDNNTLLIEPKVKSESEIFEFEWHNGKVAIKAPSGKYVTAKGRGGIDAKVSEVTDNELYEIHFVNRHQIVFQAEQQSFIGTVDDSKVRTNRVQGEIFTLEYIEGKATYLIKSQHGKYWKEGDMNRISAENDGDQFYLEIHHGKFAIKNLKGKYLKSENQGYLVASVDSPTATELYEF